MKKRKTICAVGVASICAVPSLPAAAAQRDCWMGNPRKSIQLKPVDSCTTNIRTNSNGHTVVDINANGLMFSVIIWAKNIGASKEGDAEIFYKGSKLNGYWLIDKYGDYQLGVRGDKTFFSWDPNGRGSRRTPVTRGRDTLQDTPFRF